MAVYSIGELAKLTGCKIPTIRYYEDIAILPQAERSEGNQRRYHELHLQRLKFIRHSRALGFSLEEIKQLIHLQACKEHEPHEAHKIAAKHLEEVQAKIKQLQLLADELENMMVCCEGGAQHRCNILSVLDKETN